jgi:hypothetical protein
MSATRAMRQPIGIAALQLVRVSRRNPRRRFSSRRRGMTRRTRGIALRPEHALFGFDWLRFASRRASETSRINSFRTQFFTGSASRLS